MSAPQGYPTAQPGQPGFGWAVPDPQHGPPPAYATGPTQPTEQPYAANPPTYGGSDPESGMSNDGFSGFSEKSIRRAFVRKVYGILMVQLMITVGFISLFLYEENIRLYSQRHPEMWLVAFAMTFVLLIVLACCNDFRRRFPLNMILLMLFTLCEGFLLGSITAHYKTDEVLMAIGICAVVCFALTLFSLQTKWDFTAMGGILFVSLVILLIFGLLAIIIRNRIMSLVYASLGALLFSCYLVFDTQLMLGGKHKYSISPEEYIFAALNLYLDIINIFLYILAIIGGSRN